MVDQSKSDPIAFFTLNEIRLIKQLYHELSIDELAIFFRKSTPQITGLADELGLKRKEVSHA